MDELAKVPEVAECYEQWNQLRDELERYYKDSPREHLPLSQQKEFKTIKNMVIREAEQLRLGTFTFEDARMRDEVDEDQDAVYFAWDSDWQMTEVYQSAKEVLEEYEIRRVKRWNRCRCWNSSGREVSPWPPISWASAGGTGEAFSPMTSRRNCGFGGQLVRDMTSPNTRWGSFCKAKAERTRRYPGMKKRRRRRTPARYRLGKLYLEGKDVPKDVPKAVAISPSPPNRATSTPVRSWKTVPHRTGCQTGPGAGLGVFL